MSSRVLRIAILLFEALWLNVIVPGHTRGIVVFAPGVNAASCPACQTAAVDTCPFCAGTNPAGSSKTPTQQDRSNCAICQFMAHLSLPPVYDFRPAALKQLELLPVPQPQSRTSLALIEHDHCRGPPARSFEPSQV
jgi:hypothetical protein